MSEMSRLSFFKFSVIFLGFVVSGSAEASSYVVTYQGVVSNNVDPLTSTDAGFGQPSEPDTQWPTANSDFFNAFGLADTDLIGLPFAVSFTIDPSKGYVYEHPTFQLYYSTDLTLEGLPPTGGSAGMPVTAVTVTLGNTIVSVDVPYISSHDDDGYSSNYGLDERYDTVLSAFNYDGVSYPDITGTLFDTRYVYDVRGNLGAFLFAGGIYAQLETGSKLASINPEAPLNYTLTPNDYGSIMFWLYGNPYELIYGRMTSVTIEDTSAVPETKTWELMIVGLGTVGYAMRRIQKRATSV